MGRLFIFAIGGTGARVLRSFTMLLASGQESLKNFDVYPIILDYDEENGDTKIAVRCLENYNKIHNIVWRDERVAGENGFFKSNLGQLNPGSFRMAFEPVGDHPFKDYIGFDSLGKDKINKVDTSNTKMLLESMYNTDPVSDDSEMNLKMSVGFKGNPNIGSVVFHDIDTECRDFKVFLQNLREGDKVLVVGSLFGGTGSSGIPEVIRKIRARKINNDVQVGAILVMPYFAPEDKPGGTIRHDIFNSKTKAAINYYMDSGMIDVDPSGAIHGGMIDNVYFIGDPMPTRLKYCDGGDEQCNPANIVEFVSSLAILHFLGESGPGCYKYGVKEFIIGDHDRVVNQLFYDDLLDKNQFVKPILQRLTSLTVALKYTVYRMLNPGEAPTNTSYYSRFTIGNPKSSMSVLLSETKKFWEEYKKWMDEISNNDKSPGQGNSHCMILFSTQPDLEILMVKPESAGGKRRDPKSVKGNKIDGLINNSIDAFKPNGFTGEFQANEEFLLFHGLFEASKNEDYVINVLFK